MRIANGSNIYYSIVWNVSGFCVPNFARKMETNKSKQLSQWSLELVSNTGWTSFAWNPSALLNCRRCIVFTHFICLSFFLSFRSLFLFLFFPLSLFLSITLPFLSSFSASLLSFSLSSPFSLARFGHPSAPRPRFVLWFRYVCSCFSLYLH